MILLVVWQKFYFHYSYHFYLKWSAYWYCKVTNGKRVSAMCLFVCRVQNFRHTANKLFAMCLFAMCFLIGTRQTHYLPCARYIKLGKAEFAECQIFDTRQGKYNFKYNFEPLNKFKWKKFHLQSCVTSQDQQCLYKSFIFL